jgi:nucleoside-diphosphate-sugar epimerase
MQAYREEGFPITIVRPSLTYDNAIPVAIGGWGDYTIIDRMKKGKPVVVHGDGTSLWTITHSEDFAKGLVGLLANQQAIGNAFHITSDEVLTWNQIYEAVAAAAGVKANLLHIPSDVIISICEKLGQPWMRGNLLGDKAWSAIFDNSKVKRFVPGYVATIPFAEGMQRTIKAMESDPARMAVKPDKEDLVAQILEKWEKREF